MLIQPCGNPVQHLPDIAGQSHFTTLHSEKLGAIFFEFGGCECGERNGCIQCVHAVSNVRIPDISLSTTVAPKLIPLSLNKCRDVDFVDCASKLRLAFRVVTKDKSHAVANRAKVVV